ncbi:hypothetical protein [Flammeovirga aprica]|uniref:Uncharacterized protein n=1 Tax=Flammeovirga aprica JL-4 TaxID=694437 RepID=A0A7X9S1D6_9BACT|nr:hypothetical protein [Flammeovirga aprica]NME72616.1 hypothetical protein [Flammeovirga aprica JL-4]
MYAGQCGKHATLNDKFREFINNIGFKHKETTKRAYDLEGIEFDKFKEINNWIDENYLPI